MAEVGRAGRRTDRAEEPAPVAARSPGAGAEDRAPRAPHFAVPRPRLILQLDDATTRRLTMIVAPAGSGKSVLLAQWAASTTEANVAWLSVTDADQHRPSFTRRLRAALLRLAPPSRDGGAPRHAGTLPELASTCVGVLVIEDLDRILDAAVTREVGDLIEAAPDGLRFVVTSRVDPVLPVHRLRLRDEVTEVRQVDLAFDADEARPLLAALARQPLSPDHADVLVARTEGWAAGLQLAALSLRGHEDAAAFVEAFAGNDRHVADYFGNEVLDQLPDDVRRFLLMTSVLDTVTPALCAVLTDEDEAAVAARLGSLSRQSLFVTPVDEAHGLFRYHRLFRDLLRVQLRSEHPGLEARLLRIAGGWHQDHGAPDAAAECFIAAEAWDDLVALAMRFGRTGTVQLRQSSVVRWFAALPEGERWASADVALLHAAVLVYAGNALAAEQLLTEIVDRFELSTGEEAVTLSLTAFLGQWHVSPERVLTVADDALARLSGCRPEEVPAIAGLTSHADLQFAMQVCIGRALLHLGRFDEARARLEPVITDSSGAHLLYLLHALGTAATVDAWSGELGSAERLGRQALSVADAGGLRDDLGAADACLALGVVARERNELDEATTLLDDAMARARQNRRAALVWATYGEVAQLQLARGRPEQGIRMLREARGEGLPPAPPGVAARLRALSARLLLATLDADGADRVLGAGEDDDGIVTLPARVLLAVDRTDLPTARKLLDAWPGGASLRVQIDRALLTAIVDDLDGDHRGARTAIAEAVALAEPDGNVRAFCDVGAHAQRVVRRLYRSHPTAFLRAVVEAPRASRAGLADVAPELSEQLSERELAVLRHLPSDLSNSEIAGQLYISVNTLKTHLGHIYQKLAVSSRREAVDRADELHLL